MFHAMTQTLLCMRCCFAGVLSRRSPCLWRTRNITPARNIAKPCARSPTSACERARGLARSKRFIRNEFTHQKRNSKKICRSIARGLETERCWKHDAAKRCNQTSKTHLKCERRRVSILHTKNNSLSNFTYAACYFQWEKSNETALKKSVYLIYLNYGTDRPARPLFS